LPPLAVAAPLSRVLISASADLIRIGICGKNGRGGGAGAPTCETG
jgi:hypothetical protein